VVYSRRPLTPKRVQNRLSMAAVVVVVVVVVNRCPKSKPQRKRPHVVKPSKPKTIKWLPSWPIRHSDRNLNKNIGINRIYYQKKRKNWSNLLVPNSRTTSVCWTCHGTMAMDRLLWPYVRFSSLIVRFSISTGFISCGTIFPDDSNSRRSSTGMTRRMRNTVWVLAGVASPSGLYSLFGNRLAGMVRI